MTFHMKYLPPIINNFDLISDKNNYNLILDRNINNLMTLTNTLNIILWKAK